jgi:hypothetical protein
MKRRHLAAILVAIGGITMAVFTAPAHAATLQSSPAASPATTVTGDPISSLNGKAREVLPSAVPGGALIPAAAPPVTSTFSFSNTTGGKIATFNSKLTFLSRYEFELYSTTLADTLCDARSVAATVFSQNTIWSQGYLGGLPYFYKNSKGCGTYESYGTYIFESKSPVQYVYIALWAGNNNGTSSIAYSLKHYNPFY